MKKNRLLILLLLLLVISISTFCIYKTTYKEEYNYVALGDSLAAGRNPYGVDDYGYNDYVKDYLSKNGKLGSYVSYAVSGYRINNLNDDINYNREIQVENKKINIRKALRESDIVTISIGANDFLEEVELLNVDNMSQINTARDTINVIANDIDELLKNIKRYAKKDIIVIGYYNPVPNFEQHKNSIDRIIDYVDMKYQWLCDKNNVYYIKISDNISSNNDYLPNPLDIHPNKQGYEIISNEIIALIEENIFD